MERQRVANSEWRVERQRIAGRQRIAISEWRLDKRQQEESRKWRIVSRQSLVANRQSPIATFRLAFTLTELLVAIAILSIMFTLLFIPMTQAFDNARRGRIMAELQNAADYALEIMVRELMQATEVLPQERLHAEDHTYTYPSGRSILHRRGEPLNLLDDLDRFQWLGNRLEDDDPNILKDPDASFDDDTLARIDFVVRAVKDDRLTPQSQQQVITYYLRRNDPSRPLQYLDVGNFPANRRQIFRAHWQPDPNMEPQPELDQSGHPTGRWLVRDGWALEDFSILQLPLNQRQNYLTPSPIATFISHTALTPPDIDVADLRFTVERRPESDERDRKPVAVVIEMTLRKPTPGAKARRNNPNETDVPSLFVRRRVKVVLQNVR
jgi:prepilin-type N-terminal cleavage/methylation domain-containing protein